MNRLANQRALIAGNTSAFSYSCQVLLYDIRYILAVMQFTFYGQEFTVEFIYIACIAFGCNKYLTNQIKQKTLYMRNFHIFIFFSTLDCLLSIKQLRVHLSVSKPMYQSTS